MIRYFVWLVREIAIADWTVAKLVLKPTPLLNQHLIGVPAHQHTDLGKVVFANSITLTPGTVTVEIDDNMFLVHALTSEAADLSALGYMSEQVIAVEQRGGG